ncbi:MAG: hypothetical protein LBC34_00805 [Rickettsiales bacterium]|jgi:hypothetical protein|nr:hypothetical protein [Rickettsiales bacterium]
MLGKIDQVEKIIESEAVKANPSSNENVIPPEEEEEFVDCYGDISQLQAEANTLHYTVKSNNLEKVQALLNKGANFGCSKWPLRDSSSSIRKRG